jgi:CHAT domain-containing protein
VVSGPFNGLAEPALVLSPPDQPSADDDGLLAASEIATLKLDADWILLTGCTTATGDDADGAAALAKAFLHAGARTVAASQWVAPPDPTGALVAGVFDALKREPSIGRAEALRRAQLQMLDPSNPPEYAHPLSWAALSLIGDGAPGR